MKPLQDSFFNLINHLADFLLNVVLSINRIPVCSAIVRWLLRLFNFREDVLMTLDGHKMYVNTIDRMMAVMFWKFSGSEAYERQFIKELIREGMCVVDIGANMGYHTLQLAKHVGASGKVYAFEPDPKNYRLLVKNVQANEYQNVTTVERAVCHQSEGVSLFVCEENRGDNRIFNSNDGRKEVKVGSVILDQFFEGIEENIDFIKIDTQGAECLVFSGMEGLVKKNSQIKIICEFVPFLLEKCGTSADELLSRIRGLGLNIYSINEENNQIEAVEDDELIRRYAKGGKYTNLLLKKD